MNLLLSGAQRLGLVLSVEQVEQFERYYRLLVEANRQVNLTRIVEHDAVQTRHFLDSLSCVLALRDLLAQDPHLRVIDVGAGAGFPGLPLKIVFPSLRLTLLDSLRKRTVFLERLVADLGLHEVEVVTARAEDAARDPRLRERYDVALARALAPLPVLLELCLPFLRVGGRLIALRRGSLPEEITAARVALATLGGTQPRLVLVTLAGLDDGRALVIIDKGRATPAHYPRRAGTPERQPLGQPAT